MEDLKRVRDRYYRELTGNILPFWLKNGLDRIHGGIYTALDRDGSLLESDKSVWFQGRALWVFSTAYNRIEKRPEYLEASRMIVDFLERHCFDTDGRMFFRVTEDGRGVQKRLRYFFSETFAIIGFASYAVASGDMSYRDKAFRLYEFVEKLRMSEGILVPKMDPRVRRTRAFAGPMILMNVLSELRQVFPEKEDWIRACMARLVEEIETFFVKEDLECVLEETGENGEFLREHFEGRLLNPGHSIEGAWFIMNEGLVEANRHFMDLGLKMLDRMWSLGWDEEYGGGIIQYRDALGRSLSEYHQDMKFWWPQCEAVIANLMAYGITNDTRYLDNFHKVDSYISDRFLDREYGEWYGYFHRDGSLATPIKGNLYKGPFHIPRMYMKSIEIIDSILSR